MQQCFNVLIDIYHEFLLLFYCCVLLEIKLTTTTTTCHDIYSLIESSEIPFLQEGVLHIAELTCSQLEETIQVIRDVQSSGLWPRFIYVNFGRNSMSGSSTCDISLWLILILDIFGMAFQICELTTTILLFSIRNVLSFPYTLLSQSPCKVLILLLSKFNVSIYSCQCVDWRYAFQNSLTQR